MSESTKNTKKSDVARRLGVSNEVVSAMAETIGGNAESSSECDQDDQKET